MAVPKSRHILTSSGSVVGASERRSSSPIGIAGSAELDLTSGLGTSGGVSPSSARPVSKARSSSAVSTPGSRLLPSEVVSTRLRTFLSSIFASSLSNLELLLVFRLNPWFDQRSNAAPEFLSYAFSNNLDPSDPGPVSANQLMLQGIVLGILANQIGDPQSAHSS